MNHRHIHPCFSCKLPDCDEQSKNCGLKKVARRYGSCLRHGDPISDTLRLQYNIVHRELYALERNARRREATAKEPRA